MSSPTLLRDNGMLPDCNTTKSLICDYIGLSVPFDERNLGESETGTWSSLIDCGVIHLYHLPKDAFTSSIIST